MTEVVPALSVGKMVASRRLAIGLLFLVSLMNYLDRYVIGVLLPAIKADLQLSDTQLGFITGIAFTLLYATMAIPIGRIADRHSRKWVMVISLTVWSLMTSSCGLARNFFHLAISRILVGVGEAGVTPAALSLMSKLFPERQRATAVAIYWLGSPIGILIGFFLGAWMGQAYGWRTTLLLLGVPGIMLAVVLILFLPDPVADVTREDPLSKSRSLWKIIRELLPNRSLRHVTLGAGFYTIPWAGFIAFLPSFYGRTHGMSAVEAGTTLALVLGSSQIIGVLLGAVISDRLSEKDMRWHFLISCAAALMPIPFYFLVFLWPTPAFSLVFVFISFVLGALQGGCTPAIAQSVVDPRDRGVAVALYLAGVNLIAGTGTLLIGMLSDFLTPYWQTEALGIAIMIAAVLFSSIAGLHFWLGARTIRAEWVPDAAH